MALTRRAALHKTERAGSQERSDAPLPPPAEISASSRPDLRWREELKPENRPHLDHSRAE